MPTNAAITDVDELCSRVLVLHYGSQYFRLRSISASGPYEGPLGAVAARIYARLATKLYGALTTIEVDEEMACESRPVVNAI